MITFGDVRADAAMVIRAALAPINVGDRLPKGEQTAPTNLPYVMVADDGSRLTSIVLAQHTLRVTVWHTDADSAHDVATACMSALLEGWSGQLVACFPLTAPLPAFDTDTQLDMSTFTVTGQVQGRRVPA